MKKYLYIIAMAILSMTSCDDFLTINPVTVISEADLLNQQGLDWIVTGMYSSMYTSGRNAANLAGYTYDVLSGDVNKAAAANVASDWGALESFNFTTNNSFISGPYSSAYNGVYRANTVLDMLEKLKDELDPGYYEQTQAEARFIRGIWFFELIKIFGPAVPWVGLEEYQSGVDPKQSNVDENGNYIYIWDNVIADFEFAYQTLPETWPPDAIGRPNKWAALAYETKVMMFRASPYNGTGDAGKTALWSTIKVNLENLMTNGVTANGLKYDLVDDYESLFTAGESDNTPECVFSIQQTVVGTSTSGNTVWGGGQVNAPANFDGGWGFYCPSQDLAQSFMVDANGLPYLIDVASSSSATDGYRAFPAVSQRDGSSTTVITDFNVAVDPRADISIERIGIPYLDRDVPTTFDGYARDVTFGGIYFPKKHLPKAADKGTLSVSTSATSTAKNVHLIRYAEILLWYAEALIETGTPSAALPYVNQVRERAGNAYIHAAEMVDGTFTEISSVYTRENLFLEVTDADRIGNDAAATYKIGPWQASNFATADDARAALRAEYRAELALEGRRWYDLCRWGIAAPYLNSYVSYERNFLNKYYDAAAYNEKYVCMPIPNNELTTLDGIIFQTENWK